MEAIVILVVVRGGYDGDGGGYDGDGGGCGGDGGGCGSDGSGWLHLEEAWQQMIAVSEWTMPLCQLTWMIQHGCISTILINLEVIITYIDLRLSIIDQQLVTTSIVNWEDISLIRFLHVTFSNEFDKEFLVSMFFYQVQLSNDQYVKATKASHLNCKHKLGTFVNK